MTVDSGSTLCNCSDARVASPDALHCLLEVVAISPNATYANLSLIRIKISEAYLKRLISYIIERNSVLNSQYFKRECLDRYY
jgi:hypothetical protein